MRADQIERSSSSTTWGKSPIDPIDFGPKSGEYVTVPHRGRTGFDFADTPEAACRGWFVGLVNHSNQKITANEELALAA